MQNWSARTIPLLIVGAIVALLVLWLIWELSPEAVRGVGLLVGAFACAVAYAGLYAIQRRRHW